MRIPVANSNGSRGRLTFKTLLPSTDLLRPLTTLVSFGARQVWLVLVLLLLLSFTEGVSLLMLLPMLQTVGLDVGGGNFGQLSRLMLSLFEIMGVQPTLLTVITLYILVISVRAFLNRWKFIAIANLHQDITTRLRQQLFRAVTQANWLFHSRSRSSTFTHGLTNELERAGAAVHSLLFLIVNLITASVYVILAFFLSPIMTLLVIPCGTVLSLLLLKKTQLARRKGEAVSQAYEDLYAAISEHLYGLKISKSHGTEAHHIDLFQHRSEQVAGMNVNVVENYASVGFWFNVGSVLILSFILYVALKLLTLPIAGILLLIFLFTRLVPMFSSVQQGYQSYISLLPAFDHVQELQAQCEAAAETSETPVDLELRHELRFNDVSFSYLESAEKPTLDHLELTVEVGKTTAIVGPSGTGKSTLADLAIGLISPTEGTILIDGQPLNADNRQAWCRQIGYVSQETFLFHDTIRANLRMAKPEASDEALREALQAAAALEFVAALPEGLDTVVGDRGVRLSGGERQRLALARALLRRPALLLLDEATSSLDAENERRIQRAIESLQGKMTIVVIAHRLSTIRNADVICVLEQGRLVETGTWGTLLSKPGGSFRALCEAQGIRPVEA